MKIVVAGAGEIGSHLAKMLSMEYHEITVISEDEESLEKINSDSDIVTVEGRPSSIDTLIKAGAGSADLFIAVNPDSAQDINIVSAALAKKLGAKKVTARINNEEYQKNDNRILFTDLGIDSLFYPEKIAATEIVNLLKQNNASEFMNYSHGKLQLIVYRLEECSPMVDRTVAELRERTQNLFRSVAISRDGKTIIPKSATRFKTGDVVYLVSKKEGMEQALSLSGKPKVTVRNLMILGGPQYVFDYTNNYALTDQPLMYQGQQVNYTQDFEFADITTFSVGEDGTPANIMKGYHLGKYPSTPEDFDIRDRVSGNDIPIFRYADILLTKAECILRGATSTRGDTPASLINQVRDCSGAPHIAEGDVTMQELLDERGREFICEMWRRQDLIRFGQFENDWGWKHVVHPEAKTELWRRVMPIPLGVMETNTNWEQNEGY